METVKIIEDLYSQLLITEQKIREVGEKVEFWADKKHLFQTEAVAIMAEVQKAMGENNEFQIVASGHLVSFYYPAVRVSVDVVDIEALPEHLVRIKTIKEPDKLAIKKLLDTGAKVNYAALKFNEPKLAYKILKQ